MITLWKKKLNLRKAEELNQSHTASDQLVQTEKPPTASSVVRIISLVDCDVSVILASKNSLEDSLETCFLTTSSSRITTTLLLGSTALQGLLAGTWNGLPEDGTRRVLSSSHIQQ